MQQANNFNARRFQTINHNKWGMAYDQFTRAFDASGTAHFGVLQKHIHLPLNFFILPDRCQRVVLCDEVELRIPVTVSLWQPVDGQGGVL